MYCLPACWYRFLYRPQNALMNVTGQVADALSEAQALQRVCDRLRQVGRAMVWHCVGGRRQWRWGGTGAKLCSST